MHAHTQVGETIRVGWLQPECGESCRKLCTYTLQQFKENAVENN